MADFATIKTQVSIAQVLDMLGIKELTVSGDTFRGPCPICREGNNRAFVVTPARNIFYCFAEKKGGSVIDLTARFMHITEAEAGRHIAKHFGLNGGGQLVDASPPSEQAGSRKTTAFDPLEYQRSLVPDHPALKELPFTSQTIRDFDGGYCAKGLNRGRLTLPVHSPDGKLLAFMGLALGTEQPDIVYPKGFTPPLFFNLHRVGKGGALYLVSTPMDVLRTWDAKLTDVICPLSPLTSDAVGALAAFMREQQCETLEFY